MKKTLAAVAVLGAFAGSALAADVQLYGIIDTGVGYNHIDADGLGEDSDSFEMKSGQASGSRWGIKGTEDLGNGLKVGFILENGITTDDGVDSGVMFNRESSLFLEGGFGKVAFGRIGSINNGQSSWATVGMINAFGTSDWGGYSAQVGNIMATAGQWDNMIAYQTPSFAGFKVYAQYAMGNQVTEKNDETKEDVTYGDENESSSDRYYAIGATYNNGPFAAYLAVDSINYSSVHYDGQPYDQDDSLTVTLGGSYDFEVVKVYLGAQYFDEVKAKGFGGVINNIEFANGKNAIGANDKVKGYAVSLTGDAPLWGGKAMFGVAYMDAESADSFEENHYGETFDFKRYVVSVGYDYPFSKRTDVYAVASYMQDKVETSTNPQLVDPEVDADPSAYTFYVGLRHRF
ncbi:porin [Sutterella sp. AM11-39]|uniref:porin n=1 Tax=Sutterella sp. AM11-39 TaxID=2292075 RepID=UPI000E52E661|nr:porin [Sutterella sp. AM11-39]RHJ33888.1 porin [Sutterella sp. AM11-39]